MNGLAAEKTRRHLDAVAGVRQSHRLYDVHAHPYEILFDRLSYRPDPASPGVLTVPGGAYAPPAPGRFDYPDPAAGALPGGRLREISAMLFQRVYGSVGARVFLDHMDLAQIDTALLLPVPSDSGDWRRFDSRMAWLNEAYGDRGRLAIAGSIPVSLRGDEMAGYAKALRKRYGISALKCHPVVSAIDLGESAGRGWLESMLCACGELGLPLFVHAGRYNPYWEGPRGGFGALAHLREIDFSLSSEPVILSHAGLHCVPGPQVEEELSILVRMLERHGNLAVDLSGLGLPALRRLMTSVPLERILFGSDALYIPQWQAVAMTVQAIEESGMRIEETFVQLASSNPKRTVFKDAP